MSIGVNEQTPREIVAELDKYIVGQHEAKRSVAIALRNRWRSQQIDADMREDIIPKNILMIGSTGVGKTEIARRLARLVRAPFLKVEATKFTEVGYVGRDVESMVRDLVENAIQIVTKLKQEENYKARLEKNQSKESYEIALTILDDEILELDKKKKTFNINENFEQDLEELNKIKYKINKLSSEVVKLGIRKDLIEEAKEDMENSSTNIDLKINQNTEVQSGY